MANSILRFFPPIIILSSIGFSNDNANTIDISQLALKKVSAMRTIEPPIIDGKLNDEAWAKTTVHSDFLQYRPNN